ncbi:MAG: SDR family NAD(P)-dependent oxidoreductase, partial [Streptosporangiaceae bacterium]
MPLDKERRRDVGLAEGTIGLLEGKCALITGGTTGLGLAIAWRFRREGARVVITGRDHDLGGRAEQTLGPGVRFVAADAADPGAVASSVRAAADHLGGLDVLVNNAGIAGPTAPVEQVTPEALDATLRIDLASMFHCSRRAIPALRAAGG